MIQTVGTRNFTQWTFKHQDDGTGSQVSEHEIQHGRTHLLTSAARTKKELKTEQQELKKISSQNNLYPLPQQQDGSTINSRGTDGVGGFYHSLSPENKHGLGNRQLQKEKKGLCNRHQSRPVC